MRARNFIVDFSKKTERRKGIDRSLWIMDKEAACLWEEV